VQKEKSVRNFIIDFTGKKDYIFRAVFHGSDLSPFREIVKTEGDDRISGKNLHRESARPVQVTCLDRNDMKHLMTLMLAMMALVPGKQIFAQGMASAMGEMTTVVLDGPFDVSRNPALLAQEERTGALGFMIIYQPYDSYRTTPDADFKGSFFTLIDKDFIVYDPDTLVLIGGAAFYSRTDRFAFGLSLSHSYNDEKSESFIRLTTSFGPTTSRTFTEGSKRERETQSNMNFAYLVAPGLSFGMQYQFKYKTMSSVEESKSYTTTTLESEEKKSEDTKTYASTLNFGALYRTSSLQAGMLVTAGDYTFKRSSYANLKIDDNPLPATVEYDISDVTSLDSAYNGAPGMVIGCLYSITGSLAVAAEAGFRIPLEYNENDLAPATTGYIETDITTKNHFGYLISVGMQYRIDANLTLACGGLIRNFSIESVSESTAAKSREEIDYQLYSFRFGLQKKVFDNGYVVLLSAVDYGSFSIMSSEEQSGPVGLTMKFDLSRKVMSINAGISYIHFF